MRVFVYGSLKRDYWNHALIEDYVTDVTPASVRGFTLLDLGSFPGAIPSPQGTVEGELLTFAGPSSRLAVAKLDRLEGHPTFYRRTLVEVETPEGRVKAWTYVLQQRGGRGQAQRCIGSTWPAPGSRVPRRSLRRERRGYERCRSCGLTLANGECRFCPTAPASCACGSDADLIETGVAGTFACRTCDDIAEAAASGGA